MLPEHNGLALFLGGSLGEGADGLLNVLQIGFRQLRDFTDHNMRLSWSGGTRPAMYWSSSQARSHFRHLFAGWFGGLLQVSLEELIAGMLPGVQHISCCNMWATCQHVPTHVLRGDAMNLTNGVLYPMLL